MQKWKWKVAALIMVIPLMVAGISCRGKASPEFPARGLIEYQEYMVNMERNFINGVVVYLHQKGKGAGRYYAIGAPGLEGEHLFIIVRGKCSGLLVGNIINVEGTVEEIRTEEARILYLGEKSREVIGKINKKDPFYGAYAEVIEKEIRDRAAAAVAIAVPVIMVVTTGAAAHGGLGV